MGDAYKLKIILKEKVGLDKLINFLKKEGHNVSFKEYEFPMWEIDDNTSEEFFIILQGKRVTFMHIDGSQIDNPKLKKIFEKIYNFMKKEYPIKDASEWFGYEDPYQFILPYQTEKEQWEIND